MNKLIFTIKFNLEKSKLEMTNLKVCFKIYLKKLLTRNRQLLKIIFSKNTKNYLFKNLATIMVNSQTNKKILF